MLLELIGLYDEDGHSYDEIIKDIRQAFYPEFTQKQIAQFRNSLPDQFPEGPLRDEYNRFTRGELSTPYSKEFLERLNKKITKFVRTNGQTCYRTYSSNKPREEKYRLPFANEYFEYFARRENTFQYTPIEQFFFEAIDLQPDSKGNKSKNIADYHHFNNVVLATARLIEYFSDPRHIEEQFNKFAINPPFPLDKLAFPSVDDIKNREGTNFRRPLKLMLAAYYHDLGKTIVYPRHAIEGSIILANHTANSLLDLNKIIQFHDEDINFVTEDLNYISNLVYYHDQFGTLGTGEAGYLRLVDLAYRMRHSFSERNCDEARKTRNPADTTNDHEENESTIQSARNLLDLWVLNIADMMVSIPENCDNKLQQKSESQAECFGNRAATRSRIEQFLERMEERKHDFCIAIALIRSFGSKRHIDDVSQLENMALGFAKRHSVERIRRLLRSLLIDHTHHYESVFNEENDKALIEILGEIKSLEMNEWHSIISRSITSISDFSEFCNRLSWVGQMDYSFSFFQKITEAALTEAKNQIANPMATPGAAWCYVAPGEEEEKQLKNHPGVLRRINAEFFVENLASVIIQILHHLLFREREFDRLINFEFSDARDRLTPPKIARIIAMQGPHREKRAVQLALEGIFFFK